MKKERETAIPGTTKNGHLNKAGKTEKL